MFARALIFNILMAGWTVIVSLSYIPCLLFYQHGTRGIGMPWAKGVLFLARHLLGIRYKLEGEPPLHSEPVIYAAKHQSALEIVAMMALIRHPVFILKRELLFVPFFGIYLWRMGMVPINRKGGAAELKIMLENCRVATSHGRSLAIFPEGTRIPPGEKGRYHPGVAAIYNHLNIPVVPIAVNTGLYWPKNKMEKHPGTAIISFLPPIPPGLKPREFLKRLETTIESETDSLYQRGLIDLKKD